MFFYYVFLINNDIFITILFIASDYNCDFEIGYCTWTQSHTDTFDWIRQRGNTTSVGTGPTGDHTTGRNIRVNNIL